jgi:periplasmic divalent cation tolerance protein
MTHRLIYMTTETEADAERIGRALVGERLAACVNIVAGIRSMYWWDGEVRQSGETILIAKTRTSLVDRLTERVRELHAYDCPCVVSLAIDGGNPAFLDWIDAETA